MHASIPPDDFADLMSVLSTGDTDFLMDKPGAASSPSEERGPFDLGSKRGWMPVLGKQLWEVAKADERSGYYAYIFEHDNQEVGYVRIPSFTHNNAGLFQFRRLIELFESRTRAMVLDITHNAGGSMFFMYELASMLTRHPLAVPKHVVALNEDDVAVAEDVIANAENETPEKVNYSRVILREHKAGRWGSGGRRSFPIYLGGIERIVPSSAVYTGKVLILIDELTVVSLSDFQRFNFEL